jgi:hypothetical protein
MDENEARDTFEGFLDDTAEVEMPPVFRLADDQINLLLGMLKGPEPAEPKPVVLVDRWRKHWTALVEPAAMAVAVTLAIWMLYAIISSISFSVPEPSIGDAAQDQPQPLQEAFQQFSDDISANAREEFGDMQLPLPIRFSWVGLLLLLNLIAVVAVALPSVVKWYFTTFELYTDRLQRTIDIPFVSTKPSSVQLGQVQEIALEMNILEKPFGIGKITLSVPMQDASSNAFDNVVRFVPDAEARKELINDLIREARS